MNEEKNWYVVYSRPRWEKKVASVLEAKGIECYCPLNKVQKQWSDRKKTILEPLFKGYVFVRLTETLKWDVKKVDGVINFVYWLGKPARVKDAEIDTIRKFLQEFDDVQVQDAQLQQHDEVQVKQGILMDYRGIILELSGNRAKVKIRSMGVELSAVFDKSNLERVEKS